MQPSQLKEIFYAIQNRMEEKISKFPWEEREAYLSWIAQSYEYVRYSTRILALTAGYFGLEKTADSNRFIQHAAEEKGHDRLLQNDAKALGSDIKALPILPEAEAFHKSLYYWIHHHQPTVIVGWILCLEGFAVQSVGKIYERILAAHGPKATSFLKVHSEEDEDHIRKAFEMLAGFTSVELEAVCHGMELYSRLYENIYESIVVHQTGAKNHARLEASA